MDAKRISFICALSLLFVFAGFVLPAFAAQEVLISEIKKDPAKYDLVIVGTPIWAWNVSSPVRTYLTENKGRFRKVAFFCTMGGSGAERAFGEMSGIIRKKPSRTLVLTTNQVVRGDPSKQIKRFTSSMISKATPKAKKKKA